MPLLQRIANRLRATLAPVPHIDAALWLETVRQTPFLATLGLPEQAKLRALSALFLQRKRFHGAHGLVVSDAMATMIAAQACLPLLYWGSAQQALRCYDDFVGIVVHPAEAVARRQAVDAAGVVHQYPEVLLGEAMQGGPVMLSWPAVQTAGQTNNGLHKGHAASVVIHEFMHKIDMRNGDADGYPPLPAGFMGQTNAQAARMAWANAWGPAYQGFKEQVALAERFGAPAPWLDAYGATAPAEFFAVACEAYWIDRAGFAVAFPGLLPVLDAYFQRPQQA